MYRLHIGLQQDADVSDFMAKMLGNGGFYTMYRDEGADSFYQWGEPVMSDDDLPPGVEWSDALHIMCDFDAASVLHAMEYAIKSFQRAVFFGGGKVLPWFVLTGSERHEQVYLNGANIPGGETRLENYWTQFNLPEGHLAIG